MTDRDFIIERIKNLSNPELIRILNLNFDSNKESIMITLKEAENRNINNERITELKKISLGGTVNEIITPEIEDKRLNKWNWGAFLLNGFWAYPNGLKRQAALSFIPGINLITMFYFGKKGTRLAWEANKTLNLEEYLKLQQIWKRGAFRLYLISFLITLIWNIIF